MRPICTDEMYSILDSSSREFKRSMYASLRDGNKTSLLTYRKRCRCACVAFVFGGNDDRFKLYLASKLDGVCASSDDYRRILHNWRPCVIELTSLFNPNRLEASFNTLDPLFKPLNINHDVPVPYTQALLQWCDAELGSDDVVTSVIRGVVTRVINESM